DLSDKSVGELLTMDAKEFTMAGAKVEIAQVNTVDPSEVYEKQEEIEVGINQIIEEKNLDLFLFVVTDILNNDSEVLALGDGQNNVATAFEAELIDNRAVLEGVVSRKKQIVTVLTDEYEK